MTKLKAIFEKKNDISKLLNRFDLKVVIVERADENELNFYSKEADNEGETDTYSIYSKNIDSLIEEARSIGIKSLSFHLNY